MTIRYYSDIAPTTTVENGPGLTTLTTQLIVGTAVGMPTSFPFVLRLDSGTASDELVLVSSGNGTVGTPYTIERGYGATSPKTHAKGTFVIHSFTAADFQDSRDHESATLGVHGGGHINNLFNPKEYGAIGNGIANDTAAVQSAISAMPASGGVLYIPANTTFLCTAEITLPSSKSITIKGHGGKNLITGENTSVLSFSGTGSGLFLNLKFASGLSIEDVAIRYTNVAFSGVLVDVRGLDSTQYSRGVNISRVSFVGADNSAVLLALHNSSRVRIDSCYFSNSDFGITGRESVSGVCSFVAIRDCYFASSVGVAMGDAGKNWFVANNDVNALVGYSHAAGVVSDGLTMTGNRFTCATSCVTVAGNRTTIIGNDFVTGDGVSVDEVSKAVTVSSNVFTSLTNGIKFNSLAHTKFIMLGNDWVTVTNRTDATIPTGTLYDSDPNALKFAGTLTSKSFASTPVDLTDTTTITTDASAGNEFRVTLGGNRTMAAPTNPTASQQIIYRIKQDGTGSRTLTWNAIFRFTNAAPTPVLQTAAGAIDFVTFRYNLTDDKWDAIESSGNVVLPGSLTVTSAAAAVRELTATRTVTTGVVALTDATTITVDASLGHLFTVTLAATGRTMANPTNSINGQRIMFRVKQDATGSRTLAWGTNYRFSTTVPLPVLTTTAAKIDYIEFIYNATDTKWDVVSVNKGF